MAAASDAGVAAQIIHYIGRFEAIEQTAKTKVAKNKKLAAFIRSLVTHHPAVLLPTLRIELRRCERLAESAKVAKEETGKRKHSQGHGTPQAKKTKLDHSGIRSSQEANEHREKSANGSECDSASERDTEGSPSLQPPDSPTLSTREQTEERSEPADDSDSSEDVPLRTLRTLSRSRSSSNSSLLDPVARKVKSERLGNGSTDRNGNFGVPGSASGKSQSINTVIIAAIHNEQQQAESYSARGTPRIFEITGSRGMLTTGRPSLNDRYRIEIGLTRLTPSIVKPLKDHCFTLPSYQASRSTNKPKELDSIFATSTSLDFDRVKSVLVEFLTNRLKVPGGKTAIGMPPTWDMRDPVEVLDALKTIHTSTLDCKIHRAHAQIRLHELVGASSARRQMKTTGKSGSGHIALLEDIVKARAGEVSKTERDRMTNSYRADYVAGKKWLDVMEWFGGSGIVLIFICAEIGGYYVGHGWSEFQRNCMHHLSHYLPSIKQLVGVLGKDALAQYCRSGYLEKKVVKSVKGVSGCLPLAAHSEDNS